MWYEPVEYVFDSEEWLELAGESVHGNPRLYPELQAVGAADPFDNFDGLEVKIILARAPNYDESKRRSIGSAEAAAQLVAPRLEFEVQEVMLSIILDAKHLVLGVFMAHRGLAASVEVHPADLMRPVMAAGGVAFIMAHNHPSGEPEPSQDDLALTRRVSEPAEVVGLQLLDHLVVGRGRYVSLAERGLI